MIPIYSPKDNPVHSISLGSKIIHVVGALVAVMIINHPLLLGLGLLSIGIVFYKAEEMKNWFWYLRVFLVLGTIYFILSTVISDQGENTLFWRITVEEIVFGVSFVLKLLLSLSVFILFSLTVHPDDLLRSLRRRAVRSALALSIAVRLFPTLIRDSNNIYEACISRGLPLDQKSKLRRWLRRIPLMIPLLSNSLERTSTLAESMECRGFGRTSTLDSRIERKNRRQFSFGTLETTTISLIIITLPSTALLFILTQAGGWGMKSSYTTDLTAGIPELILGVLLLMVIAAPIISSAIKGGGE